MEGAQLAQVGSMQGAVPVALGVEDTSAKNRVYLVTLSRALPETMAMHHLQDVEALSRKQVLDMIWDSLENPIVGGQGGRPRAAGDAASADLWKLVGRPCPPRA